MAEAPIQYKFSKSSKVGGNMGITYFDNFSVKAEYSGTYKISNEGKTITINAQGIDSSGVASNVYLVNEISDKTDKKFTVQETSEERRGFVRIETFVFEKQ